MDGLKEQSQTDLTMYIGQIHNRSVKTKTYQINLEHATRQANHATDQLHQNELAISLSRLIKKTLKTKQN